MCSSRLVDVPRSRSYDASYCCLPNSSPQKNQKKEYTTPTRCRCYSDRAHLKEESPSDKLPSHRASNPSPHNPTPQVLLACTLTCSPQPKQNPYRTSKVLNNTFSKKKIKKIKRHTFATEPNYLSTHQPLQRTLNNRIRQSLGCLP